MSLRLRLTLLYSTLMGVILLVISAAVTLVITRMLLEQVDETLEQAQQIVIKKIQMDPLGKVVANLSSTDMGYDVYMQIWSLDGKLQDNYRALNNLKRSLLTQVLCIKIPRNMSILQGPTGISVYLAFL